jgi:hypothetical protein
VPGAAAGLADVVARDRHPLEVRGRRQHLLQQLPVDLLHRGPLGQRPARLGDAVGEAVAQQLQLAQAEHPRGPGRRLHPVTELDPTEGLAKEPGQLALEAADLAAQLVASEALVGLAGKP